VLFVPHEYRTLLLAGLTAIRQKHHFFGELHYTEIKAVRLNAAFNVAREWLELYFTRALPYCPFKAFLAEDGDVRSFPYPGDSAYPEHAMQSLLTTFLGAIAWSYHRSDKLILRLFFDDTDNEVDKAAAWSLPSALVSATDMRRLRGRRYPFVRVTSVDFVESNPRQVPGSLWGDSELVQLCDLMLGACVDALGVPGRTRNRSGRIELARSIGEVLKDTLQVPWFQHVPVHRRFWVSVYTDQYNFAYPAALRQVTQRRLRDLQPPLFE
jgi:hypothetical protein